MRSLINLIETATGDQNHFTPEAVAQVLGDRRVARGVQLRPNARLWRGVSSTSGGGMAVYGLGLYVAADRAVAKEYAGDDGEILEIGKYDLPDNPLRFASVNDFQIWYGQAIKTLGFPSKTEVAAMFHDFADFIRALDPAVDGMQIGTGKAAFFVAYPVE
jgi:hypothetical protein